MYLMIAAPKTKIRKIIRRNNNNRNQQMRLNIIINQKSNLIYLKDRKNKR